MGESGWRAVGEAGPVCAVCIYDPPHPKRLSIIDKRTKRTAVYEMWKNCLVYNINHGDESLYRPPQAPFLSTKNTPVRLALPNENDIECLVLHSSSTSFLPQITAPSDLGMRTWLIPLPCSCLHRPGCQTARRLPCMSLKLKPRSG